MAVPKKKRYYKIVRTRRSFQVIDNINKKNISFTKFNNFISNKTINNNYFETTPFFEDKFTLKEGRILINNSNMLFNTIKKGITSHPRSIQLIIKKNLILINAFNKKLNLAPISYDEFSTTYLSFSRS